MSRKIYILSEIADKDNTFLIILLTNLDLTKRKNIF